MHNQPWNMQKSQVLTIVKAHEHLVFAGIPYQKVHTYIASAKDASEEKLAIFRPETKEIPEKSPTSVL